MKKRKKIGRKMLSFLLTLALVVGLMPGMGLTAYADSYVASVTSGETTTNYSDFATALSNWSDGSTLTLLDNVSYADTISVTSGSKTFDLNNHNITKTGDHGSVFCVRGGSLTVNGPGNISGGKGMNDGENSDYHRGGGFHVNSSGSVVVNNVTITGNQANWGGGVFVGGSGTFIMNNSVISNNRSVNYSGWTSGGGVWIESGSFVMNGGTITANTADAQICGIHVFGNSSFQVSGNAVIADNKRGDTQLNASGTITVAGTLTEGANIGVTHEAGIFTNSTNTDYNDVSKFTSDNTNYVVGRNSNGQLLLEIPVQVTYKVVNGTWSNGSTDDKTENVVSGSTPVSVPTGMIAADGYKGGAWDVDPATATITAATTFTYSFEAKTSISQDVTFKVVNGKWNDDTNADKTVTLTGYEGDALKLASDQIPVVGNKPNDTYKEGAWDVTPSTETEISAATTYTYTYVQKEKATVATAPTTKSLTYTGSEQELVAAGDATDGTVYYALGTDATTPPTSGWSTSIPTETEAGTYYVWYKVVGDKNHLDTEAEPIEVKIDKGKGDTPEEANISLWSSDMACVDAVDGQEYVIVEKGGEPDWTKAVTGDEDGTVIFEELQPYTEYDIYTRVKETENVYAGEAVSTAFLTDLAGFSVEGDTYVGETLTITTDPEDAEGLSYKWYYVNIVEEDEGYRRTELGDAIEGAEGATYTLTEDDYGKYVCVVIYRGDKEYDRSSEYGPVEYDPEKISYRNTEGAGGEWTKGSSDSLQMTFKRSVVDSETFSHFKGILVDGKAVNASDYTAEAGSVIIKLNPSFLETLTVGEHVLTAQFDDADDAEADFTVKEAAESAKDADIKPADTQADTQKTADEKIDSPKTGDETNPQLMLLVMLLAAIDMALVAFIKSKKREN